MEHKEDQLERTKLLFGDNAVENLKTKRVAVFGVGGVGGYAVEVLARSGVGHIALFDHDRVALSNLNRQIIALHSTVGRLKVEVARERILDINPTCEVETHNMFYLPENADETDLSRFDYVVDCIDTIKAKLELARRCHRLGVRLIASMGAANKVDPTAFRVSDLKKTQTDPIAKVMRKTLRKEGIEHLKVVYSEEMPKLSAESHERLGSNAFVPSAAGLIVGGEVVKDLIEIIVDNAALNNGCSKGCYANQH